MKQYGITILASFLIICMMQWFFPLPQVHASPEAQVNTPGENNNEELLYHLARLIHAEARGEPYKGQVAVGAVTLNRMEHPSFPNTLLEVIYQDLAYQVVDDGQFYKEPNDTAYRAAQDALDGHDPTGGALYFYNPSRVRPGNWIWQRPVIMRIGKHVFAN